MNDYTATAPRPGPRRPRPPARPEADTKAIILPRLGRYFHLDEEVTGRHFSGKAMRIDAVLTPKDPAPWRNPGVSLGLEFKPMPEVDPSLSLVKALGQAADYANTVWDGFGPLVVFFFPGFQAVRRAVVDRFSGGWRDPYWWVAHIAAQLGVAECLYTTDRGMALIWAGHHVVWSEADGVGIGRTSHMIRRFGAR